MNQLDLLRLKGLRVASGIGSACGLISAAWAVFHGQWPLLVVALLLVGSQLMMATRGVADVFTRTVAGATMVAHAAVFTALARDTGWIIDMHMTFFACLAVMALLADWRPIVAGTLVTAVHHLLLNFVAPQWVFPDGPDFERVVFHAVVLLVEAGALIVLAGQLESLVLGIARERSEREMQQDKMREEREKVAEAQQDVLAKVSARLNSLAEGSLAERITEPFAGEYEVIRKSLNDTAGELHSLVGTVIETVEGVVTGASEIRTASTDLAQRTEVDSSHIEQIARTARSLDAEVRDSAVLCHGTLDVTRRMKDEVDRGQATIQTVTTAMERIQGSSSKIESIVEIIDGISFQTNLLALNAGVEAARAGESGKGFAVVANEVRQLAQRSADAAASIKDLIAQSGQEVREGSLHVNEMNEVLANIVGDFAKINQAISEIANRSDKTAENIGGISTTMARLEQTMQQNAAMVEESSAAAHALSNLADALRVSIQHFDLQPSGPAMQMPRRAA